MRSRRQGCSNAWATGVSGVSGVSVIGVGRVSGSEESTDAPEKVSVLPAGPYIATKVSAVWGERVQTSGAGGDGSDGRAPRGSPLARRNRMSF